MSNLLKIAIYFISVFTVHWQFQLGCKNIFSYVLRHWNRPTTLNGDFFIFIPFIWNVYCDHTTGLWKKTTYNQIYLNRSICKIVFRLSAELNNMHNRFDQFFVCDSFQLEWNLRYQDELFIAMPQRLSVHSFDAISTKKRIKKTKAEQDIKKWKF